MVRLAAAGDPAAFDALVLRYQDRIYNLLLRMSGSAELAEDLAQETFLKAWRSLASFRQGSAFYTWLFRIALNAGFSSRRSETRRRVHEGVRLDAPAESDAPREPVARASVHSDPGGPLDQAALQARVRAGLDSLDAEYRAILILRDIEGLDYGAIAETLDVTVSAVKSRLHRARKELARELKDLKP